MLFNFKNKILFYMVVVVTLLQLACTSSTPVDKEENIIGTPVEKMSSLIKLDGSDAEQIAVFDKLVQKIHLFRLSDMTYLKSLKVMEPDKNHFVVAHERGNYVVDLWDQHIEIFTRAGDVQLDPIDLVGRPISVAHRSDLHLVVVYDDLNSVGFIQMNSQGNVERTWVGGSLVDGKNNLKAGELLANGQLVLSLSDGSLALIDVEQTLAKQKWTIAKTINLNLMASWMGAIPQDQNKILIKDANQLALVDLVNGTKLDSMSLSDGTFQGTIEKVSKSIDPHVVLRSERSTLHLIYVSGSRLQTRILQKQEFFLLSSHLDLARDQWGIVESNSSVQYLYDNSVDQVFRDRTMKVVRVSDSLALKKRSIADDAQVLVSSTSIFELFPSDLGKAVRQDLITGQIREATFFNLNP